MTAWRPHSDIVPKKHLGQHFLHDPHVRDRIIEACHFQPSDIVLEIGPGLGVLTEQIARRVQHLYTVEKDAELCRALDQKFQNIIHNDILKYNLGPLPPNIKIIGNLPYYISSPIIEKVLTHHPRPADIFFTVQLEFGQRINAKINTRDYSALTGFVQYYADAKMLFKISKACFSPAPKVESCFVHLKPRGPRHKANNPDLLFRVIRQTFQQRRKKLANALTSLVEKDKAMEILDKAKIDGELRPENISLENYVQLTNVMDELNQEKKREG